NVKKAATVRVRNSNQAPKITARRGARSNTFVPPKDGVLVEVKDNENAITESEASKLAEGETEARLGKRQRNSRTQSVPKSDASNNSSMINTTTTTSTLGINQVAAMVENSASNSGGEQ
ncbi:hypothetical protein MKX03_027404, partial [Papaver bracteatum]